MERIQEIFTKEERSSLLEKGINHGQVQILLGNDVPKMNEPDAFKFYNDNLTIGNYMETEKFGVLFSIKGGSSFIMNTLDYSDLGLWKSKEGMESLWPLVCKSVMRIENTKLKEGYGRYSEFIKIVEGKSKKDLIIVLRNPIYKWISGIYQELAGLYQRDKIAKKFLQEKYDIVRMPNSVDELEDDAFHDVLGKMISNSFENGIGTAWAHANLYNESFYNFLELNPNIDKSKLKIIDIDSPEGDLFNLFKLYHPEIESLKHTNRFSTHRLRYEKVLRAVINSFAIDRDHLAIYKDIQNTVRGQYFYYLLMKDRYKDYFV